MTIEIIEFVPCIEEKNIELEEKQKQTKFLFPPVCVTIPLVEKYRIPSFNTFCAETSRVRFPIPHGQRAQYKCLNYTSLGREKKSLQYCPLGIYSVHIYMYILKNHPLKPVRNTLGIAPSTPCRFQPFLKAHLKPSK